MRRHITFGLNWLFSEPPTYLWEDALPTEFIFIDLYGQNTLYVCIGSREISGSKLANRSAAFSTNQRWTHSALHTHTHSRPCSKWLNFFIFCRFYDNSDDHIQRYTHTHNWPCPKWLNFFIFCRFTTTSCLPLCTVYILNGNYLIIDTMICVWKK